MMEFIISNWWIILLLISLFLIVLKYRKGNTKNYKELLNQGAIIIDVRTESEYKSGHIKNSINVPLKDLTYRINEFDKKDKVLIYCWRGGLRSLSLYLVLKQIGYDVYLLDGGYKSFRKRVVEYLDKEAPKFKFNQIMGITGVGKTLFLKELSKTKQVIDFEGLANHKGSILGDIPNKAQPSQKFYETCIYQKLNEFNDKKDIWVEAESIKVGKLSIPSKVWKTMPLGKNIKLNATIEERTKYILKDYNYFTKNPELMKKALDVLKRIIPKDDFKNIEESLKNQNYYDLVSNLIIYHYDKAYKKTRAENSTNIISTIDLEKITKKEIQKAINLSKYF